MDQITTDEKLLDGKTLLVVDDEIDLRDIVSSELEFMGAKVFQAENITVAQKILSQQSIDLVISDIRMPGGTGIDLLDTLKATDVSLPPIILITGFADIAVEDAFDKGAEALVNKPFKLDDLIKMTINFTSPVEKRLKSKGALPLKKIYREFPASIDHYTKKNAECSFGRGGVTVVIDNLGKHYEIGEMVNFEFKFSDRTLNGSAACRWFKHIDQPNHKLAVGLEFMQLSDSTLDYFLQFSKDHPVLSFIPSLSLK